MGAAQTTLPHAVYCLTYLNIIIKISILSVFAILVKYPALVMHYYEAGVALHTGDICTWVLFLVHSRTLYMYQLVL